MRISYDTEVDALYIRLVEGPQECRTIRLSEEVALDLGPGERLVGIEVLEASRVLGAKLTEPIELENLTAKIL